jgi:hypothetical protein
LEKNCQRVLEEAQNERLEDDPGRISERQAAVIQRFWAATQPLCEERERYFTERRRYWEERERYWIERQAQQGEEERQQEEYQRQRETCQRQFEEGCSPMFGALDQLVGSLQFFSVNASQLPPDELQAEMEATVDFATEVNRVVNQQESDREQIEEESQWNTASMMDADGSFCDGT